MLKINALPLNHERPLLHLSMNGADIFPQNTHRYQLNRSKEKNPNNQRSNTNRKIVPEDQLIHEIPKPDQRGKQRAKKTERSRHAQRNLRVIGRSEERR